MLIWKFLYISINAQIYLSNLSIYSQSGIDSLCCICVIISLILAYIFQVDFSRIYSHQYSSRFLLGVSFNLLFPKNYDVKQFLMCLFVIHILSFVNFFFVLSLSYEFFKYPGYRYVFCKYFLQFCGLTFHFCNSVFWRAFENGTKYAKLPWHKSGNKKPSTTMYGTKRVKIVSVKIKYLSAP